MADTNNHSKYYYVVKRDYCNGSWNLYRVKRAVIKKWITEEEYKEITGQDYNIEN